VDETGASLPVLRVAVYCFQSPVIPVTSAFANVFVPSLLSMETGGAGGDEAQKMYARYREYVIRARVGTTPGVLPWLLPQVPVPGGINPSMGSAGGQR